MCYAYGSLDQATGACPMCKVFKPSAPRCPHIKEVCRNRTLHPRHDVVYLKNAEVQTFNGCGFCKWARSNPPPRQSGYQNPGWPGCCRPPTVGEQKLIGAADWLAVSRVHHIPIPAEIKAILDGLSAATSTRRTPPLSSPAGSVRSIVSQAPAPGMSRRSSYNARTEQTLSRSPPMAIPARSKRSGDSPPQVLSSLSSNTSRSGAGDGSASSLPNASAMDQYQSRRRSVIDVFSDRRSDSSNGSQHSPGRKHAELSGSLARRSIDRRPTISAPQPSTTLSKVTVDVQPQRRRAATSSMGAAPLIRAATSGVSVAPLIRTATSGVNITPPMTRTANPSVSAVSPSIRAATSSISVPSSLIPPASRNAERPTLAVMTRRGNNFEQPQTPNDLSSASSSSSGSSSETTVISDGGFTDYLSDESEAELQRQAEVKAAILAQNQLEEQEFKAARQQLAHVDLRPPKSWTGNVNSSTPRSQVQPGQTTGYSQAASFTRTPSLAGTASTHSRG